MGRMTVALTQCSECGRWIAAMTIHQGICPADRPARVMSADPLPSH